MTLSWIWVHLPLVPNFSPKSDSWRFGIPESASGSESKGRLSPSFPSASKVVSIVVTLCDGGFGGSFASLHKNLIA